MIRAIKDIALRALKIVTPPRDPVLAKWWGADSRTATGVNVNADTAMEAPTVYACVRVISETIASLPVHVYRKKADGSKERAYDHPLYRLLHDAPNRFMTRYEWMETKVAHVLLRGNAYDEIVTDNSGRITALQPLHPDRVMPFLAPNGDVSYRYSPPQGEAAILLANEVYHQPGGGFDGLKGQSLISLHRETVGLAIAAQEYASRFFGNNAIPKGGLELPSQISDEAEKKLLEAWDRKHRGLDNAHRPAIFPPGMKWVSLGMTNEDAQYLETRKFQVAEIARIFRVPPHKIGDLEKATFSNIEHQAIEFVTDTILPWVTRIEQRLNATLLMENERDQYYIGFVIDGLLRGDIKSRYEAYAIGRQWGWLSANDIRSREDLSAIDGGEIYLAPLNMAPQERVMDVLLRDRQQPEARALPEPEPEPEPEHPQPEKKRGRPRKTSI